MDLGSLDIQIFVSLVVVLGAAFVALVCDYLKGNNEQLREKNVELRVRGEERERRWSLDPGTLIPQSLFQQFFVAARQAGYTPEVLASTVQQNSTHARRSAPVEPSRADVDALRRREEAFELRAESSNREKIAEVQPIVKQRKQRKAAEDFVNPEVLAKVATSIVPATAILAQDQFGPTHEEQPLEESLNAAALGIERAQPVSIEEPHTPIEVEVSEAPTEFVDSAVPASVTPNVFGVGEEVRSEIQRLRSQAKSKFIAQFENSQKEIPVTLEQASEIVESTKSDHELAELQFEQKLDLDLQLEIERVATLDGAEKLADTRFSQPFVMQPQSIVPDLTLEEELQRLAAKQPHVSTEQGLLDEIIRASADSQALVEDEESLHELNYLEVEPSQPLQASQVWSLPSSNQATIPASDEHEAMLRELLGSQHTVSEDETLIEEVTERETLLTDDEHRLVSAALSLDSMNSPEPPEEFFEGDSAVDETVEDLTFPVGLHDKSTYNKLLDSGKCVSGVVIYAGLNDYSKLVEGKTKPQIDEMIHPATKLITSIVRDKDFAVRATEDSWLMVFPGELGNTAQRRIDAVSEKFWDFQLRNLGLLSLTFSTGAVQVEKETLADAVVAAKERMEQLRNKGKKNADGTKRRVVNG